MMDMLNAMILNQHQPSELAIMDDFVSNSRELANEAFTVTDTVITFKRREFYLYSRSIRLFETLRPSSSISTFDFFAMPREIGADLYQGRLLGSTMTQPNDRRRNLQDLDWEVNLEAGFPVTLQVV